MNTWMSQLVTADYEAVEFWSECPGATKWFIYNIQTGKLISISEAEYDMLTKTL
jgi:hypothetical protein